MTDEQIPEGPQVIPPQPLPEMWTVQPFTSAEGNPGVVVIINGLWGTTFHFLERDAAREISSKMRKTAEQGPGLITPPNAGKLLVAR